jgi:hypothetical protein
MMVDVCVVGFYVEIGVGLLNLWGGEKSEMSVNHMGLSEFERVRRKIQAKLSAYGFNLFSSFYAQRHFKL